MDNQQPATSNQQLTNFLAEWHQNPRLRLGGWLILVIVMIYGFLLLSDWEQKIQGDYRNLSERLARLEFLARQKEWTERADAAKAVSVQLEGRFWKAETRGLAQAKTQIWIDDLFKKKGIAGSRIQVEPARDMTGYEGIWQTAVRAEGDFEPRKFAELLYAIEVRHEIVKIEQLDIVHHNRPRFYLVLKAYFQANSVSN
jgi:hypothetical protein